MVKRGDTQSGDLAIGDVVRVTTQKGARAMGDVDIERLVRMAAGCVDVIRQRAGDLAQLEANLGDLDGRTCTGREYWRKDMGKPEKLVILHSIDQSCPLHGAPGRGARLRCYVGNDPARVEEAREAIAREAQRGDLERQARAIRHGLASCGYRLRAVYDALGVKVGDDGKPW